MKKYKKKDLLDLLASLEEANRYIGRANNREDPSVLHMLSLCQDATRVIGKYLQLKKNAGIALMKILEDYCEDLNQLGNVLKDDTQFKNIEKKIKRKLILLSDGIKLKLPDDNKEMVFLPYKVSMWDSMESIWKAAVKDETYDVYVVPIPYYDKNFDGTFGRMHYEGNDYPKNVPIISWKEYSISERRPNVVFIHNPYDEYNIVTSVHPEFYASNIKKYTNMLVYIPYFVVPNDIIERRLCVLPGTLFSDKVIVQSRELRKIYINELHKFENKNKCKNSFGNIKKKVLALGSPKYDKVLFTKKEDLEIPSEWNDVIFRSDGTCKKVILYNTSLKEMLEKGEKMIDKIECTINTFKQYHENVVLLWRPHPLLTATIQSIMPQLFAKYMEIVNEYREGKWGIYDDSGDASRAIVLSDVYFGDGGSIFELYRQTGKFILIQNCEL